MNALQVELAELRTRRHDQEMEIDNIENIALKQRFQDILDNLLNEQLEKEQQVSLGRSSLKQLVIRGRGSNLFCFDVISVSRIEFNVEWVLLAHAISNHEILFLIIFYSVCEHFQRKLSLPFLTN